MGKVINVVKASGEIQPFSEEKVRHSLMRAGATDQQVEKTVNQLKPLLYQNISTFEIYEKMMKILRREKEGLAQKYSLKRAIMELGPTGYPFEKFVAEVLKENGFTVEINQTIMGKCVSHEIDVTAKKGKDNFMIECKFHNQPGGKTEIKEALYTYARFLDVKEKGFTSAWLVTNTKVTQDAKAYALCVGMRVSAWDYPDGDSINSMIDASGLYPITAVPSFSKEKKQSLIDQGVVFCRDLPSCDKQIAS